ncbi:MAG: DUF1801 domain-containing protein [Acidimicrobiales bacterium]|nr:DUF1801 domain-containing protein [Acidimicrobiales bacterium]
MAENKTKVTTVDPLSFVAAIEHPVRRADAQALLELMSRVTGCQPKMWGPSIVGFGSYHYKYDSGREGDLMITGFSAQKAKLSIYVVSGYDNLADELARLGKHKLGRSCLYINKLADVDLAVLEEIVQKSVAEMRANYETQDC